MDARPATLDQHQRRRIVWFAFVVAAAIYAAVPYFVLPPGAAPMPTAVSAALPFAAAGAAVSSFVARRWWSNSINAARAAGDSPERIAARLTAACTVSWALAEAVSVIGMVAALLAQDPAAALPYAACGIAVLYLHRPAVWPIGDVP